MRTQAPGRVPGAEQSLLNSSHYYYEYLIKTINSSYLTAEGTEAWRG